MSDDSVLARPLEREAQAHDIMLADVLEGLSQPQKELSPKYFYDTRGSELFEEITELEEYYPTRTERALLERWMPEWVADGRPAAMVELGAGSAAKSRVVLDAMEAHGSGRLYVPVDVSGDFLHEAAARLREEYDEIRVEPHVADITEPLELPIALPRPTWFALLGSTLGNFTRPHAIRLLARVSAHMRADDRFLLGVDRRPGPNKSVERIVAAYDDAAGVTAAFNLNVLHVLNRELGCDFDVGGFRHRAGYDAAEGRIEMHLVARGTQTARFADGTEVRLRDGETIRTEISCKYDRATVDDLFAEAGLEVERWVEDGQGFFALVLGRSAR